jgi:ribosomal protein S18 acetylase RimI-like enzyme
MITVAPICSTNALLFRDLRLRALQDTPFAFGSTYSKEAQRSDSDWLDLAARWNGEKSIVYLALDDGSPCGMAGSYLNEHDATRALLVSMWTAPTHRQRGVGRRLVDVLLSWAGSRQAHTMLLMVTSVNASAILFYERLGFTRTGRTEPYPNDPAIIEYEMSRTI